MSRHNRKSGARRDRTSLYSEITDKIIVELEAGRVPWVQPWGTAAAKAPLGLPKNASTDHQYSGINVLLLWGAVIERGFSGQSWLTFRQALSLGANVRKIGEGFTLRQAVEGHRTSLALPALPTSIIRLSLGGSLHGAVECLGAIGWFGMILAAVLRRCGDLGLGQPQLADLAIGGIGDHRFAAHHADHIARASLYAFLGTDTAVDAFDGYACIFRVLTRAKAAFEWRRIRRLPT